MKVFVLERLISEEVPQKSVPEIAQYLGCKTPIPVSRLIQLTVTQLNEKMGFDPELMNGLAECFGLESYKDLLEEGFEFYYEGTRKTYSIRRKGE